MPVPWFLLSLALGRSPGVVSLERLVGSQDTARCSPGLSCHLWGEDVLCLPGSLVRAPGPALVPTHLQTELVLRCRRQETDCDLCVRVAVRLAVRGHWLESEDEEESGRALAPLQAQVVLSFQSYPTTRCVLLEVQVPAALAQPGQSVGSAVFDCFEAALGAEVRIWSYTQPRFQKELNLTQQLPALPWLNVSADGDDVRLVLDVSEEQRFSLLLYWNQAQGASKPRWHSNLTGPQNITLSHTDLVPCLCIQVWPLEPDSVRTSFCPFRKDPRAHRNLWRTARLSLLPLRSWKLEAPCSLQAEMVLCWQAPGGGPCQPLAPPMLRENVTMNKILKFPLLKEHPNLCVQVSNWEKLQIQECPWADSLGPLKNDVLLVETRGPQDNRSLCALEPHGCTPLPSRVSTLQPGAHLKVLPLGDSSHPLAWQRAARLGEQLLQDLHSGQCVQLWDGDDLGALWTCPLDKYIHRRWALVWLACLLLAAVLFVFLFLKKDRVKGWLRLWKQLHAWGAGPSALVGSRPPFPLPSPAAPTRGRAVLLLHSADGAGFERAVGALASALGRLPLRVAVDLWSRQELSAQGPLAWVHGQRRQTLQEGGVVVLLFSPGAAALCREWLQGGAAAPGNHDPHDAFPASLNCVLPDFLQGRAPGCYVVACFDGLLPPDAVPAPFRAVPVYSLPSQMPDFLRCLQGRRASRPGRLLADRAEQVSRALQPALDSCFLSPGAPGPVTGPE